jgi:hypothetical protein
MCSQMWYLPLCSSRSEDIHNHVCNRGFCVWDAVWPSSHKCSGICWWLDPRKPCQGHWPPISLRLCWSSSFWNCGGLGKKLYASAAPVLHSSSVQAQMSQAPAHDDLCLSGVLVSAQALNLPNIKITWSTWEKPVWHVPRDSDSIGTGPKWN